MEIRLTKQLMFVDNMVIQTDYEQNLTGTVHIELLWMRKWVK